jgi:predicted RNA binding protein YcfA (HicA-like mRNA interferase family)
MPPKLPRISGEDAIRALKRLGFEVVRQRGSHVVLKKRISREEEIGCVVPLHDKLGIGLLHNILKQARVTTEELIDHL